MTTKNLFHASRSIVWTMTIAVVAVVALMLGAFAVGIAQFNHDLMERKVIAQVQQQTRLVKTMLNNFDTALVEETRRLMSNLSSRFAGPFALQTAETVQLGKTAIPALYSSSARLDRETASLQDFSDST